MFGIPGIAEVGAGDDVARLIVDAARAASIALCDNDILVVAQKVVSKAEAAIRHISEAVVTPRAAEIGARTKVDPRRVQIVLDESIRIVRDDRVLIVETRHGFVCANAGVDNSNVPGDDVVTVLPADSDASAAALHSRLRDLTGLHLPVVISDTFGRPWRAGITNVCLGVAGMPAVIDYRGGPDDFGVTLTATVVAIADEIAGAAELLMGKTNRVPVVVMRGYAVAGSGSGRDLIRPAHEDLFR